MSKTKLTEDTVIEIGKSIALSKFLIRENGIVVRIEEIRTNSYFM